MVRKSKGLKYYESVGRRRGAVARVRLYIVGKDRSVVLENKKQEKFHVKTGEILLNYKPYTEVLRREEERARFLQPLRETNSSDRFAICVLVKGGGKSGQVEASVHGLARALSIVDTSEFRPILKKQGFLTRDPRVRERRKVGHGGKARRAKQSPKR